MTLIILETNVKNNDKVIDRGFVINNRIVHSPYQMKDEEESAGNDEVVTADAPSASEYHDTRHLFFTIVPSSLSSIQSVTILHDFQRFSTRAAIKPCLILESPVDANLNLAPGSLWNSKRTPVASSRSSSRSGAARISVTLFRQTADSLHPRRGQTYRKSFERCSPRRTSEPSMMPRHRIVVLRWRNWIASWELGLDSTCKLSSSVAREKKRNHSR